MARARPVTPPPHGFSRGCDGSKTVTRAPARASLYAAQAPAGPAPTMATSTMLNYTTMVDAATGLFTVGVFQDAGWARKAIDALKQAGFVPDGMSMIAKETPETTALVQQTFGGPGERLDVRGIGPVLMRGPLVDALQ